MTQPPVVKTVSVPLSPEAAFELFTARLGDWWPVETHSVAAGAGGVSQSVELGAGPGGQIVETTPDGQSHVWGTIAEWDPGTALAFSWHPGRTASEATEVRVTFEPDGNGGSNVTLTHTGWEVLGARAETVRDNYDQGWVPVLQQYSEAA